MREHTFSFVKRLPPEPSDDGEHQVVRDVTESGCHVVGVLPDERSPAFAYSIGLFHNYAHPEVLVFGLDLDLMHLIINGVRDNVGLGKRFVSGARYPDLLEGFDCEFLTVNRSYYRELFGYARWFYQGNDFSVVQCLWPDKKGRFPREPGFEPKFRPLQPTFERRKSWLAFLN